MLNALNSSLPTTKSAKNQEENVLGISAAKYTATICFYTTVFVHHICYIVEYPFPEPLAAPTQGDNVNITPSCMNTSDMCGNVCYTATCTKLRSTTWP